MLLAGRIVSKAVCRKLLQHGLLKFNFIRCQSKITEWYISKVITDRKSRFQARHVPITDELEIPAILAQLLDDNKSITKSASHPHMIAWRTGQAVQVSAPTSHTSPKNRKETNLKKNPQLEVKYYNIKQGFKDNGEKGAGSKLLQQVLLHHNLINILVIVTRWYDGNPIGSLRFRHIINTTLDSLRKSKTI